MRRPGLWLLVALLLAGPLACTRRVTVPREKTSCTSVCGGTQAGCLAHCAEDKGNPEVLEDIRASLCEKRCNEDHEKCMLACL